MKLLKKVGILLLTISMVMISGFIGQENNTYAATSCTTKLSINKTYKCDLDGDGDKDSIKVYISGDKLMLKVNSTTKTLISNFDKEYYSYNVKIYDLNKNDKSKEIVTYWAVDSSCATRIMKFKNNTCKLNKLYDDAMLKSYDSKNGMITFEEYDWGRYSSFTKAIGCFCIYDKVRINGYNAYNQYSANTFGIVRNNKYVAAKDLTAYSSTSGTKKSFTIKKGSKVHIYALYQKGSTKYIKVKNSSNKYGYVKVGSSMLFTKKSCVWAR